MKMIQMMMNEELWFMNVFPPTTTLLPGELLMLLYFYCDGAEM